MAEYSSKEFSMLELMFDFCLSILIGLDVGLVGIQEVIIDRDTLCKCIGRGEYGVVEGRADHHSLVVALWDQEEGEAHGEDADKG